MLERYAVLVVMKAVLSRPAKRFSVRETAKSTGLSVNACKYSLDFMHRKNMVKLERVGKTYQYHASLDSYMARQWKVLFNLEELDRAGIVPAVLKTGRSIMSIVLYGSTAMGRDDAASDIDVLVIADTDMAGKKSIAALAHGTRREINISVYSPHEWREKAKRDRVFYEQAVMDCIVLYGERPVVL